MTKVQGSEGFYSPRWSPDGSALAELVIDGTPRETGAEALSPFRREVNGNRKSRRGLYVVAVLVPRQ